MRIVIVLAFGAAALAGCAEQDQSARGIKSDSAAFTGTNRPYVATGWRPGDKTSWEQQLKNRTVQGQNDYVKAP